MKKSNQGKSRKKEQETPYPNKRAAGSVSLPTLARHIPIHERHATLKVRYIRIRKRTMTLETPVGKKKLRQNESGMKKAAIKAVRGV